MIFSGMLITNPLSHVENSQWKPNSLILKFYLKICNQRP